MTLNFTLAEFLHSDTAVACDIENLPTWEDIGRLERLADTLERIRKILGNRTMIISSGFRCPALNEMVGGVSNSAHLYGLAADFTCPEIGSPTEVCEAIAPFLVPLEIDQLIDESGWVHVGLCDGEPAYEYFRV